MKAFCDKRDHYFSTRIPASARAAIENIKGVPALGAVSYLGNYVKLAKNQIKVDDNNYLGMDKISVENIQSSLMMSGVFVTSDDNEYSKVNKEFAEYVGMESAIISQSGYSANVNVIECIATKGVPIYCDEKAHASFVYGITSSSGKKVTFKHNDLNDLRRLTAKHGPGIIVVDSLYSGWGTFAPLVELMELKKEEGHILVVDESHSLGLYGQEGRGYCNHLKIIPDFITASLSKAFCLRAGLIAGSSLNISFIKENGGPAIFSSVVDFPDIVRLRKILSEIKKDDKGRNTVMKYSDYIRKELQGMYGVMNTDIPSPIICLCLGNETQLIEFQYYLQKNSVFGAVFIKPVTRIPLIRLTINTGLSMEDCNHIIKVVKNFVPNAKL